MTDKTDLVEISDGVAEIMRKIGFAITTKHYVDMNDLRRLAQEQAALKVTPKKEMVALPVQQELLPAKRSKRGTRGLSHRIGSDTMLRWTGINCTHEDGSRMHVVYQALKAAAASFPNGTARRCEWTEVVRKDIYTNPIQGWMMEANYLTESLVAKYLEVVG